MKTIGIFAGSSDLSIPNFRKDIEHLADLLAQHRYRIVYGAGRVGLMGVLSKRMYKHGGFLIGVVPKYLNRPELVFEQCTELIITEDLHERKEVMERLSDVFIVLPGGIGTIDEFFNVLASKQLKYHRKPIFLFNINNYFKPIDDLIKEMYKYHFIGVEHTQLYQSINTGDEIVEKIERHFLNIGL
ncbi:MAG TPA: TIGR00730 family Rossman fold protein [Candidatus Hydrogenedens sp.]|nr:TIGR00730 family Rossman fold protein [Candidatus Hydrogenedens sp.]HOL20868.1 TIGR00730 family Rossman fold protein [Candidatus Hydrogenedens sp.]HPP57989.1 TIGR00730 family Rossman fold protein [Candidatus Hydrogenedens sp.]